MKGRRVIDAVAEIPDHMAAPFQRDDDPVLLDRCHAAEEVDLLHARCECLIIHFLNFSTGKHASYWEAQLREDMLGHQFVVASDDLDCDPIGGKSGQGRLGALLWRIEECGEAHKDQLRFIANHGMSLVLSNLP